MITTELPELPAETARDAAAYETGKFDTARYRYLGRDSAAALPPYIEKGNQSA